MEINVVVWELLRAVSQRRLGNKHSAEGVKSTLTAAQVTVRTSDSDDEGT